MDRLKREGNPPVGQLASPVPQYKRPGSTDYEAVEGQYGAPFATLKDASGNVVSPATDAKLEQVKSELELVKSELQTIKANQLSGDQKVQLSGTVVETVIVHNEIAITDTNPYGVNLDVSKYRAFNIWMGTTLNTPVKIAYNVFFPPGKGQNLTHREWKNDSWVSSAFNLELPPGPGYYNLTSVLQPAHRFTRMIRLVVRCDIAPTSGSILSWVEGELR